MLSSNVTKVRYVSVLVILVLLITITGCSDDSVDCNEICEKEYNECMKYATSMQAQMNCQSKKISCVGRCLNDTYYSHTSYGPELQLEDSVNTVLVNKIDNDNDCPCKRNSNRKTSGD